MVCDSSRDMWHLLGVFLLMSVTACYGRLCSVSVTFLDIYTIFIITVSVTKTIMPSANRNNRTPSSIVMGLLRQRELVALLFVRFKAYVRRLAQLIG